MMILALYCDPQAVSSCTATHRQPCSGLLYYVPHVIARTVTPLPATVRSGLTVIGVIATHYTPMAM